MKGRNFYNLKRKKKGDVKSLGGFTVGFQQQYLRQSLSQSNQFFSALGEMQIGKKCESIASGAGIHQGKSLVMGMDLLPWAQTQLYL